LQTLLLQL